MPARISPMRTTPPPSKFFVVGAFLLLFASSFFLLAKPPLAQAESNGIDFENGILTLSGDIQASAIKDMVKSVKQENIKKIVFKANTTIEKTWGNIGLFEYCTRLESVVSEGKVNFPYDDEAKTTASLENMFCGCFNLDYVDLMGFDTTNVSNLSKMFRSCRLSTYLNVTSFNTSHVTNMSEMFCNDSNTSELKELDLSSFNTWNLVNHGSFPESGMSLIFYGLRLNRLILGPSFYVCPNPLYPNTSDWSLGTPSNHLNWATWNYGRIIAANPSVENWQNNHLGETHEYFGAIPETGWAWTEDGWRYINEDGSYAKNCWQIIDGSWYYFKENGAIESNCWAWIGDAWYGFWANGAMCTGWVWDSGYSDYFYCGTDGRMVKGVWAFVDGEWYGFWGDGTMCRGWVWDSGWNSWFFCYANGIMARNTWIENYWVNASGIWT